MHSDTWRETRHTHDDTPGVRVRTMVCVSGAVLRAVGTRDTAHGFV